jgi:hypothetical protein
MARIGVATKPGRRRTLDTSKPFDALMNPVERQFGYTKGSTDRELPCGGPRRCSSLPVLAPRCSAGRAAAYVMWPQSLSASRYRWT